MRTGSVEILPGMSMNNASVTMTTTLFITGAHAVGLKMCLALRTADSSANTP